MGDPTKDAERVVTIPRAALQGSRRALREQPPLLRGGTSQPPEPDQIEVPVPVALRKDVQDVQVLHVDDDPEVTQLTKTCLERIDEDFAVTGETSVVGALDHLQDGEFDCVISDYDMPNTDGIEFLEIVREQYPDLPFILFTGKGSEEVASEAIAAGVTDYMQKGGGLDKYEILANRVRNAVEQYRTRQRFWDSLSWYRRLVEQDIAGVFIAQDGAFVYVNERLAELFGYAQRELIEEPLCAVDSDAGDGRLRQLRELDHDDVDTFQYELVGERSDGSEIEVEIHGGAIQYEGRPGWIGIVWHREG